MNNTTIKTDNQALIRDPMFDLLIAKLEIVATRHGISNAKFKVRKPKVKGQ